jgi:hypothetical protein
MGLGALLTFFMAVCAQTRDLPAELVGIAGHVGVMTGDATPLLEGRVQLFRFAPAPVATTTELLRGAGEQLRIALPVRVVALPTLGPAGPEVLVVLIALRVLWIVRLDRVALQAHAGIAFFAQIPVHRVASPAMVDVASVESLPPKPCRHGGPLGVEEDLSLLAAQADHVSPRTEGKLEPIDATLPGLGLPLADATAGLEAHGDAVFASSLAQNQKLVGRHHDAVLGQKDLDRVNRGAEQKDAGQGDSQQAFHREAQSQSGGRDGHLPSSYLVGML